MRSLLRSKLTWIGLVLLLVAILVAVFGRAQRPRPGFAWINPAELWERTRPSALSRLKFRILRLPGPLWGWYMKGREQIQVQARLFTISAATTHPAALPPNCYTNLDGVRAWVLSPEQLTTFTGDLGTASHASLCTAMAVTTYDGGQFIAADASGATPTTNSLTIQMLPTVAGTSFEMTLGAASTSSDFLPDGTFGGQITNITAACRVLIPNGGGLLLASPATAPSKSPSYWVVLSAVAVDSRGKPKKL